MEEFVESYGKSRHLKDILLAEYKVPTLNRRIKTADGISLDTLRAGPEPDRAVIICHGFAGNKNVVNVVALAEDLSRDYSAYTFDFRGHGLSTGRSTFYFREILDLNAVVRLAREDGNQRVGVIGFSMGGMVAMRYAAIYKGLESLIVIGVTGDIRKCRTPEARWLCFLLGNKAGRMLAARTYGVRIDASWKHATPPKDLVDRIAPQPLTIIQGEDDYIFEPEEAETLYRLAGDNARLKTYPSFGHADESYGHLVLEYIKYILEEDLGDHALAEKENT